jgi:phospholipid/cholesterol/gamma-HCH transport system permease protein
MQDGGSADRHIAPLERGCGWTTRACDGRTVVFLDGDWIARDARAIAGEAGRAGAALADAQAFAFDATMLGNWDSALIAFLWDLQTGAMERGLACDSSGLPASVRRLLDLIDADRSQTILGPARETVLAWLGWRAIGFWEETLAVTRLLGEVLLRGAAALRGRAKLRGVVLLTCLRDAGVAALPIVTIVNFLVGAILAFVGAAQLRRFGAGIFVADLVGISIVREMAAVMTATVMAGRTGGAYAAEIATMQGREEIDALLVIGIPIPDYLLLPRICALIAMMPFLYLYGCAVGLLGGFLVSVVMLDLTSAAYIVETRAAVSGTQWLIGLTKSIAFGALIAFAACRIGLRAGRSAADVGHAATSAVVIGIVGIIAIDAIFALCANALGI